MLFRKELLDMYRQLLLSFPKESYLVDIYDYVVQAADAILDMEEKKEPDPEKVNKNFNLINTSWNIW